MISIEKFECNMFQENCYVASDETKECVVVDCGAFYPEERSAIVDYIKRNQLKPVHLICTHGHLDHNFGNDTIFDNFALKPEVHAKDKGFIEHIRQQAQQMIGLNFTQDVPPVGKYFDDGYAIRFGTHTLSAIHTPGHTPGSVMFYCQEERLAFSGDTLFRLSIGRTDFQMGSYKDIVESLRRIAATLPPDTTVLPGHGEQTTIGFEAAHNPYIK